MLFSPCLKHKAVVLRSRDPEENRMFLFSGYSAPFITCDSIGNDTTYSWPCGWSWPGADCRTSPPPAPCSSSNSNLSDLATFSSRLRIVCWLSCMIFRLALLLVRHSSSFDEWLSISMSIMYANICLFTNRTYLSLKVLRNTKQDLYL